MESEAERADDVAASKLEEILAQHFRDRGKRLRVGTAVTAALIAGSVALGWYVVAAGIGLVLVFGFGWQLLTFQTKDKGAQVLRKQRGEIVWAYYQRPSGIVLALGSGQRVLLNNAEFAVIDQLAPLLPHATLGYTPELAAQFAARPESLRRSAA
jgi:hypothetical protein